MTQAVVQQKDTTNDELVVRQTSYGHVVVIGGQHVSAAVMNAMFTVLDPPEANDGDGFKTIKSVMLRTDGQPLDSKNIALLGSATPDCGGIALNLVEIMTQAIAKTKEKCEGLKLSVFGVFHFALLMQLAHEMYHLIVATTQNLRSLTPKEYRKHEKEAQDFGFEHVVLTAEKFNLEPDQYINESAFGLLFNQLVTNGEDSEFAREQLEILTKYPFGYLYDKNTRRINGLRDYCRILSDNPDGDVWTKPVAGTTAVEVPKVVDTVVVDTAQQVGVIAAAFGGDVPPGIFDDDEIPAGIQMAMPGVTLSPAPLTAPTMMSPTSAPGMVQPTVSTGAATPMTINAQPETCSPGQPAQPQQTWAVAKQHNENLAGIDIEGIVWGIYFKIYQHIFTTCRPIMEFPGFMNPAGVNTPIQLTVEEARLIHAYDGNDGAGRWRSNRAVEGFITGSTTKNQNLPVYVLHIKIPDGRIITRKLLPQSADAGKTSKYAEMRRQGQCILHFIDPALPQGSQYLQYKIVGGQKC